MRKGREGHPENGGTARGACCVRMSAQGRTWIPHTPDADITSGAGRPPSGSSLILRPPSDSYVAERGSIPRIGECCRFDPGHGLSGAGRGEPNARRRRTLYTIFIPQNIIHVVVPESISRIDNVYCSFIFYFIFVLYRGSDDQCIRRRDTGVKKGGLSPPLFAAYRTTPRRPP
jgi:hypothetical protein